MKRPFALIGFTYLIALVAAVYFGEQVSLIIGITLVVGFGVSMFFKELRIAKVIPIALFVAALGFFSYYGNYCARIAPVEVLKDSDVVISGTICEMPYKDYDKYYYFIETDSISEESAPQNIKIRLSTPKALDADEYDKITAKVHMHEPKSGRGYTSKIYYQARGIFMFAYLDDYDNVQVETPSNKPMYYYVIKAREKLLSSFRIMLPEKEASLISAVLIGDKHSISKDIKSDFQAVGVSHMLVVSGMHLSILSYFLLLVLKSIKLPKRYCGIIISFCIVGFMALTGFSYSIMRAGIMSIIYFGSVIFGRHADSLNSIGLAVFIICLLNPFAAADIGLLLSFFSVIGILLLQSPINNFIKDRLNKLPKDNVVINWIVTAFSVSLAATIFTSPIVMLVFKRISLITPIANIIIVFPLSIMIVLALISLILYLVHISFIAVIFAVLAGFIADYMIYAAHLLAKIPFATVPTAQKFLFIWMSATLILIAFALLFRNDTKLIKLSAILSSIILFVGIFSYQLSRRNIVSLAVLDTGDGLSVVLNKNAHTAIISSGGEKYYSGACKDYLNSLNAKNLDYFLISDSSKRSSEFSGDIIKEYSPYAVTMCYNDDINESLKSKVNLCDKITYFNRNTTVDIWDNVRAYVQTVDDESYVYIKINDVTFLLSFKDFDETVIPDSWKNPNFFISSANIDNFENINANYVILAQSLKSAQDSINTLAPENPNILATAGDGSIVIDCISENYISLRREY